MRPIILLERSLLRNAEHTGSVALKMLLEQRLNGQNLYLTPLYTGDWL